MPPQPLSSLDIATGWVLGSTPQPPQPHTSGDATARDALENGLLQVLTRGTCAVGFSGGRDSSAVLAVAAHVARRDGFDPPLPVTMRYPADAGSREDRWQQAVVRHLRLPEWSRLHPERDGGLLGQAATRVLRAEGLLWPHNAYLLLPAAEAVSGGTLLTGLGGDGLFGAWRWARAADVRARRRRPRLRDVARIGLAHSSPGVRRLRIRHEPRLAPPDWLRPAARREAGTRMLRDAREEPARWDLRVAWWARRRYHHVMADSAKRIGRVAGTHVINPLLDPAFLSALAAEGGANGYGDRTAVMRALVGDLLPQAVIERGCKANFTATVWDESAREFARSWDGSGVDIDLVEPESLRRAWLADRPLARSGTCLHAAWLHHQGLR